MKARGKPRAFLRHVHRNAGPAVGVEHEPDVTSNLHASFSIARSAALADNKNATASFDVTPEDEAVLWLLGGQRLVVTGADLKNVYLLLNMELFTSVFIGLQAINCHE